MNQLLYMSNVYLSFYSVSDGLMYYGGKTGYERRFVPASEEEKLKAFNEAHILKSGQHFSEFLVALSIKCYFSSFNMDKREVTH